jgi:glutaredoxin
VRRVTLYTAHGCSLCGPVRRRLESVRADVPFELEEVDISGVPELEERYREWLPVVEIDGERAFVYRLDEDVLRTLLGSYPAR